MNDMKTIHFISLIARVALMVTLVLGLGFWIAQVFVWIGLLTFLAQIGFPGIHEAFGSLGVLGLFILGAVAIFTKGSRWLGVGGMIYALVVPAFGLTQSIIPVGSLHWLIQAAHLLLGIGAMMLILRIENRSQYLKRKKQEMTNVQSQGLIGRMAVLASSMTKEQGATSAQPQGRPYPPLIARLARAAIVAHVALYRRSSGKIGGRAQGMPVLLLTTTGRKSGKSHTTALVYVPDGDDFVVIASNSGQARLPNWWLNMRKSKEAQIEVGRKRLLVSVQEASGEERQRLWSRIVAYRAGHEVYQQRTPYPLPVVILHPEEAV